MAIFVSYSIKCFIKSTHLFFLSGCCCCCCANWTTSDATAAKHGSPIVSLSGEKKRREEMIPIRLHSATIRALKGNWWGVTRPTCDVRYDSALRIYPTRDLPHTHEMARGSKLQHPHQRERQRVKKVFTQLPSPHNPSDGTVSTATTGFDSHHRFFSSSLRRCVRVDSLTPDHHQTL